MICDSLNGMKITQTILITAICTLDRSNRNLSGWELEHRDWRAIPGQGLLLAMGKSPKGGDHIEKCLWRKTRRTWRQGDTAESHTRGGVITIVTLSSLIRTGTSERPQRWWPFKCLMCWETEKDPNWGSCKGLKWLNGPGNKEGPAKQALWLPAARG